MAALQVEWVIDIPIDGGNIRVSGTVSLPKDATVDQIEEVVTDTILTKFQWEWSRIEETDE